MVIVCKNEKMGFGFANNTKLQFGTKMSNISVTPRYSAGANK